MGAAPLPCRYVTACRRHSLLVVMAPSRQRVLIHGQRRAGDVSKRCGRAARPADSGVAENRCAAAHYGTGQVAAAVRCAVTDTPCHAVQVFYAHWCGHCKQYAPRFKELAARSVNASVPGAGGVSFRAVNCVKFSALCDTYAVKAYPTVKAFDFPGDPAAPIFPLLHSRLFRVGCRRPGIAVVEGQRG